MDLLSKVNVRKRRSPRLYNCDSGAPKKECPASSSLGAFEILPTEILHQIFSNLDILDLSKLCIASKSMLNSVESFRTTCAGRKKFLMDVDVHTLERSENWPADVIHSFFKLGIYMKRSSFLKSTSKRLKHIGYYLNEKFICKEYCGDGRKCISFYCYGTFLHTVISGWDDIECLRVLEFIHQSNPVYKYISRILTCSAGVLPHLEVYVRCFYRRAFMDVLRKKEDRAFWLNQILKPYPMIHQARILQILFLLKSNVGVNFTSTVRDRLDIASLSDLGGSLVLLSDHSHWSDDSIISVIDEIIVIPSSWHPQNVAALLLNCGENIIVKVLVSKAINNRFTEIICIAHHLLVVCVKAYQCIHKASKSIWSFMDCLKTSEKVYVASELVASFKDAILDMFDLGGEPMRELEAVLGAMTQFTQGIVNVALKPTTTDQPSKKRFTQVNNAQGINPMLEAAEE